MLLDTAAYARLLELLGESEQTVHAAHFLRRRRCLVFTDDPQGLRNVVVRADTTPPMTFATGDEVAVLANLISRADLEGICFVPQEIADTLHPQLERAHGQLVYRDCLELRTAAAPVPIPSIAGYEVRRLGVGDLALLERASEELAWTRSAWASWAEVLAEGIVVAALADQQVASIALTFARSRTHDDIGVATLSNAQGRGLCTACSALLMAEILAAGRTPVWSVSVTNAPSRRVSEKLGFVTRARAVSFSARRG